MRIFFRLLILSCLYTNCGTYLLLTNQEESDRSIFKDLVGLNFIDSSFGLVHYWPLDGDLQDKVGGLDLVEVGGSPTLSADRFGIEGKAYYYDGQGAIHESIAQGPLFLDGTVSSFTISVWVKGKYRTGGNGGDSIFLSQGGGLGMQLYYFSGEGCTGRLRVFTNNGGTGDVDVATECKTPENLWYHMVFTWDIQTQYASLYVNNVLVSSKKFGSFRPWDTGTGIDFGTSSLSSQLFQGSIDEVRIYNRVIFPVSSL
ncbi:LamG domain-containing protein [Leptospira koniambonensis]|uniref:LamG domain-containing protein n=1 Tax=Leptospira koniambonensis TaxID=2484950 RepID=A0A4R9J6V3_9LEPT|nr:LamG domain-containing protein [Leptospira koniambonensis]TGL33918.1 LamG domain-containing protein [Leptospira koniambonensis]